MTDIKQYVKDYIEGKIESKEFLKTLFSNEEIFDWLQSVVPEGKVGYYNVYTENGDIYMDEYGKSPSLVLPYDVKRTVYQLRNSKGGTSLGKELNIHCEISRLLTEAFPNEEIKADKTIENKFNFLLAACPEYIDGPDVDESEILERFMNELPAGISKTQRIKIFKERIKAEFHIEGNKYPRWIQGGEWPFCNGKPMKFLYQKSEYGGEVKHYIFEDPVTKERKTVTQFY